jgi:general secretion pathway protein D
MRTILIVFTVVGLASFSVFPSQALSEDGERHEQGSQALSEDGERHEQGSAQAKDTEKKSSGEKPSADISDSAGMTPPVSADEGGKPEKESSVVDSSGQISFFFDDADIFEVIRTVFGEVLRVNYIIDPKVKGRVNFRTVSPIQKAEVLPVMEIIFRINGVGYVVEEGLYRVLPLDEAARELVYSQIDKDPDRVAMELFTFKNINLRHSIKDIENAIGLTVKGGAVRVLPIYRLNAVLVVASTQERLDYVRSWVMRFDSMFDGARPKVYVYPVQNTKAENVADMLWQIFFGEARAPQAEQEGSSKSLSDEPFSSPEGKGQQSSVQKKPAPAKAASRRQVSQAPSGQESLLSEITRIIADEKSNAIIILATPEDYGLISETIKKIDIVPRQVMIEALVASVTLTDNLRFGLQWTIQNEINIKPFSKDVDLSGPLTLETPISSSVFSFTAFDNDDNIKLLIQALAEDNRAKVLSAPHILVSDNREATIQVGDVVPIASQVTTNTQTTPAQTTTTIQYKDTGTILSVRPQVNDSGLISLEITQEVSVADTTQVLGTEQFVIRKREVTTNLVAQDGQTIVIGGLIDEQKSKARTGIPFLSRIPFLGYLFGSTIDDTTRTELVILLTPYVIRNQTEAEAVSSKYLDRIDDVEGDITEDLPVKERNDDK